MSLDRAGALRPGRRGVALLVLTIALLALCSRSALIERAEWYSYDARASWLTQARVARWSWVKPEAHTDELVLVIFDDRTVDTIQERLPIARSRLGRFLELVGRAGASVTVLDYYMQGHSEPAEDDALAAALKINSRVIMASRPVTGVDELNVKHTEPRFKDLLLGEASPRVYADADSLHRTGQLFARERGVDVERLSLPMLAVAQHARVPSADLARPEAGEVQELSLTLRSRDGATRRQRVPLVGDGGLLLEMPIPFPMFRTLSFIDVPAKLAAEPGLFKDKIVLMGDTHLGSIDFRWVPTGAGSSIHLPGVYLQAATIANLLGGVPRERASFGIDLAVLFALGLFGALAFVWLPERAGAVALVLLLAAHALACTALFLRTGVWVNFTAPAVLLVALFAETIWMRLAAEGSARLRCEVLLSSYFSPAAAAGLQVADDPRLMEKLVLVKEMLAPDGYQIVSPLGQGGMAVVFKAIQQPLGRTVALKLMSPRLYQDQGARGRFVREAKLASTLLHPNVVAVFDSGDTRGVPFIALEYVAGQSLKSLIEHRKRLDPAEAAGILRQVLRGLAAIHAAGIVHRDIKSENVMISTDHRVKIADFGIAKADTSDGFKTLQDIIMGTPAYLAPDVVVGDRPTPQSDIYSLGIMLFEMLTGTVPFLGESAQAILLMHVNEPMPEASARGVELPRGLNALMRRMVEKKVADRPASCTEILLELERLFPDAQAPTAQISTGLSGKHATLDVTGGGPGTVRTSRKTLAPNQTSQTTRS